MQRNNIVDIPTARENSDESDFVDSFFLPGGILDPDDVTAPVEVTKSLSTPLREGRVSPSSGGLYGLSSLTGVANSGYSPWGSGLVAVVPSPLRNTSVVPLSLPVNHSPIHTKIQSSILPEPIGSVLNAESSHFVPSSQSWMASSANSPSLPPSPSIVRSSPVLLPSVSRAPGPVVAPPGFEPSLLPPKNDWATVASVGSSSVVSPGSKLPFQGLSDLRRETDRFSEAHTGQRNDGLSPGLSTDGKEKARGYYETDRRERSFNYVTEKQSFETEPSSKVHYVNRAERKPSKEVESIVQPDPWISVSNIETSKPRKNEKYEDRKLPIVPDLKATAWLGNTKESNVSKLVLTEVKGKAEAGIIPDQQIIPVTSSLISGEIASTVVAEKEVPASEIEDMGISPGNAVNDASDKSPHDVTERNPNVDGAVARKKVETIIEHGSKLSFQQDEPPTERKVETSMQTHIRESRNDSEMKAKPPVSVVEKPDLPESRLDERRANEKGGRLVNYSHGVLSALSTTWITVQGVWNWLSECYFDGLVPFVERIIACVSETTTVFCQSCLILFLAITNIFNFAADEATSHVVWGVFWGSPSVLCYYVFCLMPIFCNWLMAYVSNLPHFTPHLLSNLAVYYVCRWISYVSTDPSSQRRKSTKRFFSFSPMSTNSTVSYSGSSSHQQNSERFGNELCQSALRIIGLTLPIAFFVEGFSQSNASFMLYAAHKRMILAYILSLFKRGHILSPVAWVGWSVQVLLGSYLPAGSVLNSLQFFLGLAFIRLVSLVHMDGSASVSKS